MLTGHDILRARFAPDDRVEFTYRRSRLDGTVIRTNPKRAVVRVAGQEYHVPYESLIPQNNAGPPREERIRRVHKEALTLLQAHGLQQWSFRFDHSTRRAGCCSYHDRCISIAFMLACHASDEDIKDSILHEIAHALVGKKHNHDAVWKALAREIGCSGERCHRLRFAPPRYSVTCETRCWTHTAERRNARLVCRTCGGRLIYSAFSEAGQRPAGNGN